MIPAQPPAHPHPMDSAPGSSAPCSACPVPFQGLPRWAQVPNWGPGPGSWCLASSREMILPSYSWPQKLITDAPASSPVPVDGASAGGSNGSELLLVEPAMEAGAGGAVVSASTGARTASAQGCPGRCWMGACSSCSLPRLCSPASLGQVQPHSCASCSLNPFLMGPYPLRAAPRQPRAEVGGSAVRGGAPCWGWWPRRGGAGVTPTAAHLWARSAVPVG